MKTEEAPSCLQQATPVLGFGEYRSHRERGRASGSPQRPARAAPAAACPIPIPILILPGRSGGLGLSLSCSGTRRPCLRFPFSPHPNDPIGIPGSSAAFIPRCRDYRGEQRGGSPPSPSLALWVGDAEAAKATARCWRAARWHLGTPKQPWPQTQPKGTEPGGDRDPTSIHPVSVPASWISPFRASGYPGPWLILGSIPGRALDHGALLIQTGNSREEICPLGAHVPGEGLDVGS